MVKAVRPSRFGDRVFGFSTGGAAQAELAVLSHYAPIPPSLDFPGAAALPSTIETATRALDQLGVASGGTLLINGVSGSIGSAAVQFAVARGAVDIALDVAASGVLPELIEFAGSPEQVVTIADFAGAQEHGVRFSRGDTGRALHVLSEIGELVESGKFSLPVAQTFPLPVVVNDGRGGIPMRR
nr:hypothetical protein [Nocardia terpenica]